MRKPDNVLLNILPVQNKLPGTVQYTADAIQYMHGTESKQQAAFEGHITTFINNRRKGDSGCHMTSV